MFFRSVHNHRQFLPIFGDGTNYGATDTSGATNHFSTPDSTALFSLRSTFTITLCLEAVDWTSAFQWLFSYGLIGTNNSMNMALYPDGSVTFQASTNGTADNIEAVSTSLGFTDGVRGYIKVTRTSSSSGGIKILKSTDGISWTDITSSVTNSASALYNTNQPFILGGYPTGAANSFNGRIYSMKAGPGYEGPSSVTVNFAPNSYISGSTFTSPTGEVWTISGNARIKRRSRITV